jgi:hypothetical protein
VLALAVADLVDADAAKLPSEVLGGGLLDPVLDEAHHGRPVDAELATHALD